MGEGYIVGWYVLRDLRGEDLFGVNLFRWYVLGASTSYISTLEGREVEVRCELK